MGTLNQVTDNVSGHGPAGPEPPQEENDIDIIALFNSLLRHWRLALAWPIGAILAVLAFALLSRPVYTATTSFVPETGTATRIPSALAGLAGQLGVSLGTEPTQSPRFYADVLLSRQLMERVLLTRFPNYYTDDSVADSVTLLQALRVRGVDFSDSLSRGLTTLKKRIRVRVSTQTNIVTLRVNDHSAHLAADVATHLVRYLNDFNTKTRNSRARERREFVEQRVSEGERDLRQAEQDLKVFFERNRSWQQSPALVLQEGELRRRVQLQQELYLTLKQEFETARIEEVNDTPVLTLIDPAVPPRQRSKPKVLFPGLLALVLGGIVGAVSALAAEHVDRARQAGDKSYRDLQELRSKMREDILRLLRGRTTPK